MIHFTKARQLINEFAGSYGIEYLPLQQAGRRVLAKDVVADRDYPPFNRSAMDGYACRIEDFNHFKGLEIAGEIQAGTPQVAPLEKGTAAKIFTGAPLPENADAVIRKEDAVIENNNLYQPEKPLKPFQNIARRGEDVQSETPLVQEGSTINMAHMTALATAGAHTVAVQKHPKIGIIQTGNEIVPVNKKPDTHSIRSSHEWVISSFLSQFSIVPFQTWHAYDEYEDMNHVIEQTLSYCDIILLTGGVSAGDYDLAPGILKKNNVEEVFHKVNIKPGKPLWFGHYNHQKVVFGFPGNPLSTQISCKLFLEPFLKASFGMKATDPLLIPLNESRSKKNDLDHFFPARLINDEGITKVEAKPNNGSGDITACINTDGFVHHPGENHELSKGDFVAFRPWGN